MGILLAIDTAAPRLGLALLRADGDVDTLVEPMAQGQAERLFPAIAELLERNRIAYPDLTRIAVTTGPGSFTGLRIGLSAARGLGLALGIPVVGLGSLETISLGYANRLPLKVVLDAKRGQAYRQHFFAPGRPTDEPMLVEMGEALGGLPEGAPPVTSDVIDMAAFARFADTLDPGRFPPEAEYVRDADARPQQKFRIARVAP